MHLSINHRDKQAKQNLTLLARLTHEEEEPTLDDGVDGVTGKEGVVSEVGDAEDRNGDGGGGEDEFSWIVATLSMVFNSLPAAVLA